MSPDGGTAVPTVRCHDCMQVWLVPGLRPGEGHSCKGCGRIVLISGRESSPASAPCSETEVIARSFKGGKDVRCNTA